MVAILPRPALFLNTITAKYFKQFYKVMPIKHAQYFDLRLKSLIMIDHKHRCLYRHPNSRSIVGECFEFISNAHLYVNKLPTYH